jgi:hypothetical protein
MIRAQKRAIRRLVSLGNQIPGWSRIKPGKADGTVGCLLDVET